MKKIFLLLIMTLSLFADVTKLHVNYEAGISIYGRVGTADVHYQEDNLSNTYKMDIVMSTTGIVKKLTGNQENSYMSEGVIQNGVYLPTKFVILVTKNFSLKRETYIFDHKNKIIEKTLYKKERESFSEFDISAMSVVTKNKIVENTEHDSIKYYRDDYLSLYLNVRHHNFTCNILSYLDKKDSDSVALINDDLFTIEKHEGEDVYNIHMTYDGTLFFQEALATDILFFGDAYIRKTAQE